jgi:hypothetical protein
MALGFYTKCPSKRIMCAELGPQLVVLLRGGWRTGSLAGGSSGGPSLKAVSAPSSFLCFLATMK